MKETALFVCIHNSARSQMAEAFLNIYGKDRFIAESAGLEPGKLNPLVVAVMKEIGIDISGNATKGTEDMLAEGRRFDYVITVCDESAAERCPLFPGRSERQHWGFPDPSAFVGSAEEKIAKTRDVRDAIRAKVEAFIEETKSNG